MGQRRSTLAGLRVVVVEDEAMLMLDLKDMLAELGCDVVGTASRIDQARAALARDDYDVALLDLNLSGERIDPLAADLAQRNRPFVLTTGFGSPGILAEFRDRPLVNKPYSQGDLARALLAACKE